MAGKKGGMAWTGIPLVLMLVSFLLVSTDGVAASASTSEASNTNSQGSIQASSPALHSMRIHGMDGGEEDEEMCVILARITTFYKIGLYEKGGNVSLTVTFWIHYNWTLAEGDRLAVINASSPISYEYLEGLSWSIRDEGGRELCRATEEGLEDVWGALCARLVLTSHDYYLRRLGVMDPQAEVGEVEVPEPLVWVILLASLLPFFPMVSRSVSNLVERIEEEGIWRRGGGERVFMALLQIFLPLLTMGVTILLVGCTSTAILAWSQSGG